MGAIYGIIIGFLTCLYTLLIPYAIGLSNRTSLFITEGLFHHPLLKPFQLFGLEYLEPVPHALFWSMLLNTLAYFAISVSFKGNYRERNYAEMYVEISQYIIYGIDATLRNFRESILYYIVQFYKKQH